MNWICTFMGHKWTKGEGYHYTWCDRCKQWYWFNDPEDSPQGKGRLN